uniref:Sodium/myo-inositol cotransporter-like n=1 Tax=Saccoglossus kowalevskii TaxID=10224 RepID=A0ABM0LVD1_SACKO|nr:PREDICTED: sodium/myo-inositol cotransporter-like [Saccoglossus kowalevskii]
MKGRDRSNVAGYFLAGKNMIWFMVGGSLFSSNIGSEHFVGLAGSGAATGISVGAYELNAMYLLQLLGWVFLPVYIAGLCYTMPEYLSKRFGGRRIRVYYACLSLALYILVKISVDIYSASLFIEVTIGWNLYASVLLILGLTSIYVVTGGLAAVIYTDTVQTVLILIGAITLMIFSLVEVGGLEGLYHGYMAAVPNTTLSGLTPDCGYPRNDSFQMLHSADDDLMPWVGFFLGQTTASIWYWCADQVIVQRTLAAKNMSHAKGGTLMAGYLKILPTFLFVIPGMISRVLYTNAVACVLPESCEAICGNSISCSNIAYPLLVVNILPIGFRGLMLAVMLAALMSSLSSICNSASTLFTLDIWSTFRNSPSEKEKMIVGRILVFVLLLVSILWIPVVQATQGGLLFIYIQTVTAYLTPPITAVFLGGILWSRINEQGAFWSLMVGIVIGSIRFILDLVYPAPGSCEEDTRPPIVTLQFMYFALLVFWICVVVMVAVSLLTQPLPEHRIVRLTFWTRHREGNYEEIDDTVERHQYEMDKGKEDKAQRDSDTGEHDRQNEDPTMTDGDKETIETSMDGDSTIHQVSHTTTTANTSLDTSFSAKVTAFFTWFCGVQAEKQLTSEEKEQLEKRLTSIAQTRREKWILNMNLVLILSVVIFLFIFFTYLWVLPYQV